MRRFMAIAAIAALPVLGLAGPAAADVCVGRQGTVGVCVNPQGNIYLGCFYLGDDQCTDVYAPAPDITACWLGEPSILECA